VYRNVEETQPTAIKDHSWLAMWRGWREARKAAASVKTLTESERNALGW